MSNQFGKTWWGEQWLNSLSNIDYSNRLPRGKSYANKGAVISVEFNENNIMAKVAGSRATPYEVTIILPPFFDPEIKKLIKTLAQKPVIISKLLNRELDPELLLLAEQAGLKVFPKQWTDFKMQCNCPDWAVPCKHLASVIYKISAEIDNNPFLVFELHKLDLPKELKRENIYIQPTGTTEIPVLNDLFSFSAPGKKSPTKLITPENEAAAYQKLDLSALTPIHEPLIELLPDKPVFYQLAGNFKEKYATHLRKSVRNAQRVFQDKISIDEFFVSRKRTENPVGDENSIINPHTKLAFSIDDSNTLHVVLDNQYNKTTIDAIIAELWHIPQAYIAHYQPSVAALKNCVSLAMSLLANGAVIPQMIKLDNKKYIIRWLPATLSKEVNRLLEQLDNMLTPDLLFYNEGKVQKPLHTQISLNILSLLLDKLIYKTSAVDKSDIFCSLFFSPFQYGFNEPGQQALSGGIHQWLQKYYINKGKYKPSIVVEELAGERFCLFIDIKETSNPLSKSVSLEEVLTNKKFDTKRFDMLQSLSQLSSLIGGLDTYINSKGKTPILFDLNGFAPFLLQMIPVIQLLDVDILLPKSLQHILKPKASIKLKRKATGLKSFFRLDKLLDFDWQVAIGDHLLDEKEFLKLVKNSEGLIKYKSNYIYVNSAELEKLHKHFTSSKSLSSFDMLRAALSNEYEGSRIHITDEVRKLIKELTEQQEMPLPLHIQATLRPYQHRGYSWLYRNTQIGFGSILADDMGLGKTLQVITALLKFKENGFIENEKVLVIAPTGLLSNWQAEIEKFAPTLRYIVHHGASRKIKIGEDYDVMLTSYGVARRDAETLKKMKWYALVTDEAQNIKNPETAQTKAVKSITAHTYIAMSGTPVENRLSELWSIMDFCNKGFLGSAKDFNENFSIPVQNLNDMHVAEKLKTISAPFLMRRLKSDKTIISDLPDKIEMDCYGTLAKEQAGLYEKTLQKAMEDIEGITKSDQKSLFVRQGLVLQMILALKQICNHPTQYLKNNVMDASMSGKLEMLFDKLESIVAANEKVLIFTQFAEMGKLLKYFIKERFKEEPLFYHGGCSLKQRKEMVDGFQNDRADKIFILSLKAAGTGLNLTAANHVIHYDLWWNPAVEAQATDRAYRIGQKSNVMVHRFITKGTFEEKINEMIQNKKNLANMTVATGENWIGNMSNKELKEMFVLG